MGGGGRTGRCWRGRKVCAPHLSSQGGGCGGWEPKSSDLGARKRFLSSSRGHERTMSASVSHLQNGRHNSRISPHRVIVRLIRDRWCEVCKPRRGTRWVPKGGWSLYHPSRPPTPGHEETNRGLPDVGLKATEPSC